MGKKTVVATLTILFLGSASYALDPLGPPKALLDQGQWSPSVEYAYSEIRVELDNRLRHRRRISGGLDRDPANKAYANLRYGVLGNVDLFGRVGLVDVRRSEIWAKRGMRTSPGAWAPPLRSVIRKKLDWGVLVQLSRGESEARPGVAVLQ